MINLHTGWSFSSRLIRGAALLLLLLCHMGARAQTVEHTENKPDQTLKSGARVDPSTLGMGLDIPLGYLPGRAGTGLPVGLSYSSKVWRIEYVSSHSSKLNRHTQLSPRFAEHSASGWTTSLAVPRIEYTGLGNFYRYNGDPKGEDVEGGDPFDPRYYIARINVHLPDGSSHELRRDDEPHLLPDGESPDFSGVFRAVDGSRLRYDNDAKTLYLPDGSRYLLGDPDGNLEWYGRPTPPTYFIDRNGNTLTYDHHARQWTDTLDRAVGQLKDSSGAVVGGLPLSSKPVRGDFTYQLPRAGGGTVDYVLKWRHLSEALTVAGQELRYKGSHQCHFNYPEVSPSLFGSSYPNYVCAPDIFNPVVLSEIMLPTRQAYRFTYNLYGEIDKVHFPTGGYERFVYEEIPGLSFIALPYRRANRGVTRRWVSASGVGNDEAPWEYGVTTGFNYGPPYTAHTVAPDLTRSERVLQMGTRGNNSPRYGFDDARVGTALEERAFSAPDRNGNRQLLRRRLTEWAVTAGGNGATSGPRVTKEVTLVLDTGGDALAQTTTYQHDADLNVTSVTAHDYAPVRQTTAQAGAVTAIPLGTSLGVEETTYLVNDPDIAQETRDAYRARNLVGLPSSTRIKNASGVVVAQFAIRYDEADYAPLPCGAAVGWSDPSASVRGMATTARTWLDTTDAWVETHSQFDACGNPRKSWDAHDQSAQTHGRASEVEYCAEYKFAYPTLTRSAVPDPSGQYGSAAALTTETTYDPATGRVLSTKDANKQVTTFSYAGDNGVPDPLGRLRRVTLPGGGWTKYTYDRSPDGDYVYTQTLQNTAGVVESSVQFSDGLGRPSRTFVYENQDTSKPYLTTDTEYDRMGRTKRRSLQYRTTGANSTPFSTDKWVETAYDALGRMAAVKTMPDGAAVTTAYVGNQVTVTDQAGKQRRSVTDALGRLTQVYEDPNGLNYLTSYAYDALGNLRQVDQGGQQRFFAYDSLGRLVRAKNPEQGILTPDADFPTLTDAVTGNAAWSLAYGYDAAGNLTGRKDARNVKTAYTYDGLGRNKTITYTDSTPVVSRYYDNPADGANGLGRAWKSEAARTARTTYERYDEAGRPLRQSQQFWAGDDWGTAYTFRQTYDLAGRPTSQTYPSGHTTAYAYDVAGRPASFSGNLGDGAPRAYSSGIIYDELGGMKREKYGTQTPLYKRLFYNSRGQLTDIRLGTYHATDDGWWNRGAILNVYSARAGWVESREDNNGNLRKQMIFVPNCDDPAACGWAQMTQFYGYDSLNRLTSVEEKRGETDFFQTYSYDRWGNRTINAAGTWDTSATWDVPEPPFEPDAANPAFREIAAPSNRLYAPGDGARQPGQKLMGYDAAGNLVHDAYTGAGARTYDAEGRMTAAQFTSGQAQTALYTYDSDGRRVQRKAGARAEVWQVYGAGGELLAEYPAHAPPSSPQKEYGYRAGELLITAEVSATQRANHGLSSAGATAAASTAHASGSFPASGAINGDRKGLGWGAGGGWNDATPGQYPDWVEVTFSGAKAVDEVSVFTLQDECASPVEPAEALGFTRYGVTKFSVQAWVGGGWVTVPGGAVSANNKVWRRVRFPAVVTTKVRVAVTGTVDGTTRLVEVEAWGPSGAGGGAEVNWLVSDHLGTPRMVVDQSGALSGVRRHDYLPFGEEIGAGIGGRTGNQGYSRTDNVRQKFTGHERDDETGLDYMRARYYAKAQGRFSSPDTFQGSALNPQTLNLYAYVQNDPLNFNDPTGRTAEVGGQGLCTGSTLRCGPQQDRNQQGGLKPAEVKEEKSTTTKLDDGRSLVTTFTYELGEIIEAAIYMIEPRAAAADLLLDQPGGGGPPMGGAGGGGGGYRGLGLIPYGGPAETAGLRQISLGLDPHFKNLAVQTGSLTYRNWYGNLTNKHPNYSRFGRLFFEAVSKADRINFALDDFYSYTDAFRLGSRGFTPNNYTNAEFHSVFTNRTYYYKTQFYYKGDGLLYQPVDAPFRFGGPQF